VPTKLIWTDYDFQGNRLENFAASRMSVVVAANATLTRAVNVGITNYVSAGPINLPADDDWLDNDEIEFITTSTTPINLRWPGFFIVSQDVGSSDTQVIGGAVAAGAIVKKKSPGLAYLFTERASTDASHVNVNPPIAGFPTNAQSMLAQLAGNPYTFSFGDATPNQILIADANQLIKTVTISILMPFNGVNPRVSVGDATNPQRLMPSTAIDPSDVAEWEYNPNYRYSAATPILLTLVPDGSTQGNGIVYIERS
jgi:hypothetical protein